MKHRYAFGDWVSLVTILLIYFHQIPFAAAVDKQRLNGHVPAAAKKLTPMKHVDAAKPLHLAIGLPLRDQAGLEALLHDIYDPGSPLYRQYLTPEQFTERFGPTKKDYEAVKTWAKSKGLSVKGTHLNRMVLDVEGSAAKVERALGVKLHVYQHPTEDRTFFAPDDEPSLEIGIPVATVGGLDDYYLRKPRVHVHPQSNVQVSPQGATATVQQAGVSVTGTNGLPSATGSGPSGSFRGLDFRAAYVPGTTLTGAGQKVGLVQFDGFATSDISAYAAQTGLPMPPLTIVPITEPLTSFSGNNVEVCLDIEMVMCMAPNVSGIYVYEAPNPTPWEDMLSRMATDNTCRQLSCSWFGGPPNETAEHIFMQMAAQGQTFYCASGDNDAFTGGVGFPDDSPNITLVGGTTLTTSGPKGTWVSEKVWNWGNGIGSGGGISVNYSVPSWQQGINLVSAGGSTAYRNIPDVALTADNVYVTHSLGSSGTLGGTSCAAPLWAGLTALINEQAAAHQEPPIGFLNPLVYNIGKGSNYAGAFHDITVGNNTSLNSPDKFFAKTGYDLCTGWGTPTGTALINLLAPPDLVFISPKDGFSAAGPLGGPFDINSEIFLLTNGASTNLPWTALPTCQWLTVSATNGVLAAGGTAEVTVSLNSQASNLVAGTYTGAVRFSDPTAFVPRECSFTLTILGAPIITNEPTAQTSAQAGTAKFVVGAFGIQPISYQWRFSGNDIAGATDSALELASLLPSQTGVYSVVLSNSVGSTSSSDAMLTVIASAAQCVDDFENGIDQSQWVKLTGSAMASDVASAASGSKALVIAQHGSVQTIPIDTQLGADIHFYLRIADSVFGYSILPEDGITFDYSIDGGSTWSNIDVYDTEDYFLWKLVRPTLPDAARSPNTMFRWQHKTVGYGYSSWALDQVAITTSNAAPWVVHPPGDRYVLAGSNATFSVLAEGAPPLSYQWQRNDVSIPGATDSSYTISSVSSNDVSIFAVVVSNAYGRATSTAAKLGLTSFTNRPSILYLCGLSGFQSLHDSRARYAAAEHFRARLEQTGLFQKVDAFRLSNDDKPSLALLQNYDAVLLSASPTPDFTEVGPRRWACQATSDALADYLQATGGAVLAFCWGFDFDLGRLAPYSPFTPAWAISTAYGRRTLVALLPTHPVLEGVSHFDSGRYCSYQAHWAGFGVAPGAMSLALWSDTAPFGDMYMIIGFTGLLATRETNGVRVVGINSPAATIDYDPVQFSPTSPTNNGMQLFANALLWSAQRPRTVPHFIRAPANQTVGTGVDVLFSALASGPAPLTYQWLHNGVSIPDATNVSIAVTAPQLSDGGTYTVVASNTVGTASSSAFLFVIGFAQQPADQQAKHGDTATFSVIATGTNLTYQWFRDEVPIISQTNPFLTLRNVRSSDVAAYSVVISNPFARVESRRALLTIIGPPLIAQQPASQYVLWGTNITLQVVMDYVPPPCRSASLLLWLKADSGVVKDSSGNVIGWQDCSANHFDAVYNGGLARFAPSPANFVGGLKPAIEFNGSSTYMFAARDVGDPDHGYTSFIAYSRYAGNPAWIQVPLIFLYSSYTPWYGYGLWASGDAISNGILNHYIGPSADNAPPPTLLDTGLLLPENTWRVCADRADANRSILDVTDSSTAGRTNFTFPYSQGQNRQVGYCIGGNLQNGSNGFAGQVAEVLVYKDPLNDSEREGVIHYLEQKHFADLGGAYSFQWRFNGTSIPGQTTAVLQLTNVQPSAVGSYAVVVSNNFGAVTSSVAVVVVNGVGAPVITGQPQRRWTTVGGQATFAVTVGGLSPISYQWLKDGVPILGAKSALYVKTNVGYSDVGFYSVIVSNQAGFTRSVDCELAFTPAISLQPADTNVALGAPVTLSAAAVGSASFQYQWYFNTLAFPVPGATTASLHFDSVQQQDTGQYLLQASTWTGIATSRAASLTVVMPPSITQQPQNVSAFQNDPAVLSVAATGGALNYQWRKNGVVLPNATNAVLQMTAVRLGDAGLYSAIVTNLSGAVTSGSAMLNVMVDGSAPTISISTPLSNARVKTPTLIVRGRTSDNDRVVQVVCGLTSGGLLLPASTTNNWTNWSTTLTLVPGTNKVVARAFDPGGNATSRELPVFFVVTNQVTVFTTGAGSFSGITNGAWLEIGRSYNIKGVPAVNNLFADWSSAIAGPVLTNFTFLSTSPTLKFLMQSNLVLQATFVSNQFPVANGSYAAVFSDPAAPSVRNAGLFNVTLSGNGLFSGKILQGTTTSPFSGKFDVYGHARTNVSKLNGVLDMQINFGSAPRTIQCSLSNANFGVTFNAVSTPYTAIRPANGLAGSYTASLARSNAPATEGAAFALITNAPNGTVNIRSPSALADGTAFAKKSVLTEDARSPVYVPLYNNTGLLVGWLNFSNGTSGNTAGTLTWIKPAMPGSLLFPSGITSTLAVAGSPYQKPSLGDAPLAATNFSLQLAGGDLSSPLSIDMVLRTNLLSATASSIYKPTLKIDPATGAIGGGVTINGVSHLLHGAVLQNATNGGGFFVDPAHTGSLKLSPK